MAIAANQQQRFNSVLDNFKNKVKNARGQAVKDFSLNKLDDVVRLSVLQAYRDVQRVLSGIGAFSKEKKNMLNCLIVELVRYFNGSAYNQTQFDRWHKTVCDKMKSFIANYKRTNKNVGVTYGVTQKIINMSFKYIYCFDYVQKDRQNKIKYFEPCHFTLDSNTVKWLKAPKVATTMIDDYACYEKLQERARNKPLSGIWQGSSPTLLEKEVIVWYEATK